MGMSVRDAIEPAWIEPGAWSIVTIDSRRAANVESRRVEPDGMLAALAERRDTP
jgi:hypothetical protein